MSDSNGGLTGGGFWSWSAAPPLYETMTALGLINVPAAWAGPPKFPKGRARAKPC